MWLRASFFTFQLKVVFELGSVRLRSLKQTSWSGLFVPSLV